VVLVKEIKLLKNNKNSNPFHTKTDMHNSCPDMDEIADDILSNKLTGKKILRYKILLNIKNPSKKLKNINFVNASIHGHYNIVNILLRDSNVKPRTRNNMAFTKAAENGHYEIVKLLLKDSRADPSAKNNRAIRYASRNGHYEIVKLLLQDSRVDPSADNNCAIRSAAIFGGSDISTLIMKDFHVDPSTTRCAPRYGYYGIVKMLLQDSRVDRSVILSLIFTESRSHITDPCTGKSIYFHGSF
jgi:ankyrin repeat protein